MFGESAIVLRQKWMAMTIDECRTELTGRRTVRMEDDTRGSQQTMLFVVND